MILGERLSPVTLNCSHDSGISKITLWNARQLLRPKMRSKPWLPLRTVPRSIFHAFSVALIAMWRSVWGLFGVPLSPDDQPGRKSVASREPRVAPTKG